MTKRHSTLVLLAASLILGAGCHSSTAPKDESDWSYTPPDGLKQQEKELSNGNTLFLGPTENGFAANLQVKAGTNKSQSAEDIGKGTLVKETTLDGATVKEQEAYQIPDSDAYTWLIQRKSKSGNLVDQRQFVVVKNGIVVLFTMTASDTTMTTWDQALADSLKSFKWGK